jgi:hypothetical protein
LRNIVDAGSVVDQEVNIAAITNEVILPIINDLLNLNTVEVIGQVTTLVGQVVSDVCVPKHPQVTDNISRLKSLSLLLEN